MTTANPVWPSGREMSVEMLDDEPDLTVALIRDDNFAAMFQSIQTYRAALLLASAENAIPHKGIT